MEKFKTWLENAWWSWKNCIDFRLFDYNDNIDRCAFFEELNYGWYQMEIYPHDDLYLPTISEKRRKTLDQHPPVTYVSKEAYDKLQELINKPPDPKVVERLREIMSKKAPWDEEW